MSARNRAKHTAIEPVRYTPWIANLDQTFDFGGGVFAHTFQRQVKDGFLRAIVGHEPIGPNEALRWHISISHGPKTVRYPTWDEQVQCLRELGERGVTWHMILPPDGDGYVNLHETTFHWHEWVPGDT